MEDFFPLLIWLIGILFWVFSKFATKKQNQEGDEFVEDSEFAEESVPRQQSKNRTGKMGQLLQELEKRTQQVAESVSASLEPAKTEAPRHIKSETSERKVRENVEPPKTIAVDHREPRYRRKEKSSRNERAQNSGYQHPDWEVNKQSSGRTHGVKLKTNKRALREAVVWSEVIGKPRGFQSYGRDETR